MTESSTKKNFTMPHSLIIILQIIVLSVILTWIIPAGEFQRIQNAQGVTIIDPGTFQFVESSYQSIFKIPHYGLLGYTKAIDLILLILFSGGALEVIVATEAMQTLISRTATRFAKRDTLFLVIIMLFFAVICTTIGVNTFMGFAPIVVMFAMALGYDSLVGISLILLGGAIGFSTGMLNLNTTIVSQRIAELPLYSGIGYRFFCFIVYLIVTIIYLVRYAKKVQKNPAISPMYEMDKQAIQNLSFDPNEFGKIDLRKVLVLCSLVFSLVVIVYGGLKLKWDLTDNTAVFIWLGTVTGLIAGFSPSKIAGCFVTGARRMIGAVLILGLARSISEVLTAGKILDTIVYSIAQVMYVVPKWFQGTAMLIANVIINIFIVSGSGQAAVVMPIFLPVADLSGITRQTAILAYGFGDGFGNYIIPMSTALMGNLSAVNIPYEKWVRYFWKLFVIWMIVGAILIFIAQTIKLGPM